MATKESSRRHPLQVSDSTHRAVRELAAATDEPMSKIVEQAVERYRSEWLLQAHNEAWSELMRTDPEAIAAFADEDELWDRTSADGSIA